MNQIAYEEDVDDVEFPTIKFSNDLVYQPVNNKNNSFCSKIKNIFKNKAYFFILISSILVLIVIIITTAVLVSKKRDNNNNNINNDNVIDDWNGGSIILEINNSNGNEINIINNDKINLSEGDYKIESTRRLRRLDVGLSEQESSND